MGVRCVVLHFARQRAHMDFLPATDILSRCGFLAAPWVVSRRLQPRHPPSHHVPGEIVPRSLHTALGDNFAEGIACRTNVARTVPTLVGRGKEERWVVHRQRDKFGAARPSPLCPCHVPMMAWR